MCSSPEFGHDALAIVEEAFDIWHGCNPEGYKLCGWRVSALLPKITARLAMHSLCAVREDDVRGIQAPEVVDADISAGVGVLRSRSGVIHFLDFWRAFGDVASSASSDDQMVGNRARLSGEVELLRNALLDSGPSEDISMDVVAKAMRDTSARSLAPSFWESATEALVAQASLTVLNLEELTVILLSLLYDAVLHDAELEMVDKCNASQSPEFSARFEESELASAVDFEVSVACVGSTHAGHDHTAMLLPKSPRDLLFVSGNGPKGRNRSAMLEQSCPYLPVAELSEIWPPHPPVAECSAIFPPDNAPPLLSVHALDDSLADFELPIASRTAMLPLPPAPCTGLADLSMMPMGPADCSIGALGSRVFLNIYDVSRQQGVRRLNGFLAHQRSPVKLGGVFHAGVEVHGQEWCYGFSDDPKLPGVSPVPPTAHPQHHFRQTLELPPTTLSADRVAELLVVLSAEYPGPDYDLLRRNCCHFADAFVQQLGCGNIPSWVYRLCRVGARIDNVLGVSKGIQGRIFVAQGGA